MVFTEETVKELFGEDYLNNRILTSFKGLLFISRLVGYDVTKVAVTDHPRYTNLKPDSNADSETQLWKVSVPIAARQDQPGPYMLSAPLIIKHHPKGYVELNRDHSLDWNENEVLSGFFDYFKEHPDDPLSIWGVPIIFDHRPSHATIARGFSPGSTLEDKLKEGDAASKAAHASVPLEYLARALHILNNPQNQRHFEALNAGLEKEYNKPIEEKYAQKLSDYLRALAGDVDDSHFDNRLMKAVVQFMELFRDVPLNRKIITRDYHTKNMAIVDTSLVQKDDSPKNDGLLKKFSFFDWGKVGIGSIESDLADYLNDPALNYAENDVDKAHSEFLKLSYDQRGKSLAYDDMSRSLYAFRRIEPLRILRAAAKDPARRDMHLAKLAQKFRTDDRDLRRFLDSASEIVPQIRP